MRCRWTCGRGRPKSSTDFARDDEVRVVVLTGAGGKAFVSGADISRFESERSSLDATRVYNQTVEKANASIYEFPKPTIAMIRGYCIGGGLGLAVCCDLRICSDNSKFAIPAAKLGLGYGYAGVKRLIDVVGPAFAKEIFYTARQFDAEEARAMGHRQSRRAGGELENYVKYYADTIATNAPLTVKAVKYIVGEVMKDESKRDLARCAENWSSNASPATTISRAARPSWRSASRRSPGPDRSFNRRRQAVADADPGFGVSIGRAPKAAEKAAAGGREDRAWRRLNCAV